VDGETRRDLAARIGLPLAFGFLVFAVLLIRNHGLLARPIFEHGDFAANSLLVDDALHFRLLVGNASKYRFNHPGPALLYVQALGQQVGYRSLHVVPAAFNGQLLGVFAFQGLLFGLVTRTINRHLRSIGVSLVFVAVALLMLSGRFASGGRFGSAWPPWLAVLPFALALVAGASVAVGELSDLPALALATGLLWHLHASFVGLVGASLIGLAVFWYVGHRHRVRESLHPYRRQLIYAGAIEAIFLFPVLLELVLHFPGPWGDYLSYVRRPAGPGLGTSSVFEFVSGYWGLHEWIRIVLVLVSLAGVVLARTDRPGARRRYLLALFGATIWATVLTTAYAAHGVDNVRYTYEAYWYAAAPALAVAATAGAIAARVSTQRFYKPAVAVVAAIALAFGLTGPSTRATYRGASWLPAAVQAASVDVQRAGRPIGLTFPPDSWSQVAGLLVQARRLRVDMCVEAVYWTFLVTKREVCSADKMRRSWVVYAGPESLRPAAATHAIYETGGWSLDSVPLR
jgi:hypothetical protein